MKMNLNVLKDAHEFDRSEEQREISNCYAEKEKVESEKKIWQQKELDLQKEKERFNLFKQRQELKLKHEIKNYQRKKEKYKRKMEIEANE